MLVFFFNDTATTEIYTLSLHDALPISDCTYAINHRASVRLAQLAKAAGVSRFLFASSCSLYGVAGEGMLREDAAFNPVTPYGDRKSTRLNSSHLVISYAVFCLKKKKNRKSRRSRLLLMADR